MATYYISDSAGIDAVERDGKSHAQAWKTISWLKQQSLNPSDNAYFLCGDSWFGEFLDVDWAGTAINKSVVGAYYMDGGVETIGVSGNKPIIQGSFGYQWQSNHVYAIDDRIHTGDNSIGNVYVCVQAGTSSNTKPTGTGSNIADGTARWAYYGPIPAHNANFGSMLNLGAAYCRAENILVKDSDRFGVRINDFANDCELVDVDVDVAFRGGYIIQRSPNVLLDGITAHHTVEWFPIHKLGGLATGGWPGICAIIKNSHNLIVRNSLFTSGYGEGISTVDNDNALIEDNVLYENRSVFLSFNHTTNGTVRNNLSVGSSNTRYHRETASGRNGNALSLRDETGGGSGTLLTSGMKIYNNLFVRSSQGIFVDTNHSVGSALKDTDIIHNTFVNMFDHHVRFIKGPAAWSNNRIMNNIFADYYGDKNLSTSTVPAGTTMDYNLWSRLPTSTSVRGPNDVYADPLLSRTSWDIITAYTQVSANDFIPTNASPAKGACQVIAGYDVDYNSGNRGLPGNPTDMGAFIIGNADVIAAPVGVSGTGAAGDIVVQADIPVLVSGVSGVGAAGSPTVTGDANATPDGVSGSGIIGLVNPRIRTPGDAGGANVTTNAPEYYDNIAEWVHQVAAVANRVADGKLNSTGEVTLSINTTTTVVTDYLIGHESLVQLMPVTPNAAAEITTTYVALSAIDAASNQFTITHTNNTVADRKFRYVILG